MKLPDYVRPHPTTRILQYRRVIAPRLQPPLNGKKNFVIGLGDRKWTAAAARRYAEAHADAETKLAEAQRQLDHGNTTPPMAIDEALNLIGAWKQKKAQQFARERWQRMTSAEPLMEEARHAIDLTVTHDRLEEQAVQLCTPAIVLEAMKMGCVIVAQGGHPLDLEMQAMELPENQREMVRDLMKRAYLDLVRSELHHVATAPAADLAIARAAEGNAAAPLSVLCEAYLADYKERKEGRADKRFFSMVRLAVRRLIESIGEDLPASRVTRDHLLGYQGHLQKLPDVLDRSNSRRSIRELQGARPERPRLSRKSVRKHFDYLGSMFEFGKLRGYCSADPTEGIKPRLEKRPANPPRIGHTDSDVKTLFSSPNYHGHAGDDYRVVPGRQVIKDHRFWLPLIGVFTGARLDEIGSARVQDVRMEEGIAFIQIVEFIRPNNKTLRTLKSGARKVPLHAVILEAAFIDYRDRLQTKGEHYLFPLLNHDANDPTGSFGSWFGRHCHALNKSLKGEAGTGVDDPRKDFHSFRHTFKRACRCAGIPKNVFDALMGHSHADVSDGYGVDEEGTTFDLLTLNEAMQKVRYDDFPLIR